MNRRSVYRGATCLYCHRKIRDGRAAIASTYYIRNDSKRPFVTTQSRGKFLAGYDDNLAELELRIVYHRSCIEKVLANTPLEPEQEQANFDEYRQNLLVRYGLANAEEEDDDEQQAV